MNLNEIKEFLNEDEYNIYLNALANSSLKIPVGSATYQRFKVVIDKIDNEKMRRRIQVEKILYDNKIRNMKNAENKNYLRNFRKR